MADRNLLSILLNIAAGVGAGTFAARRAARLAQDAKDAAEGARFAAIEQAAKHIANPTAGQTPSLSNMARRAASGGHVIAGMPAGTENARTMTQILTGQEPGYFSAAAKRITNPIPPPIVSQVPKRPTFRHAAKRVFGELLGLRGSRINPYTLDASEDEEYQRRQRQTPPPPPRSPGFRGVAQRVSGHAGGWMQAKGAKIGGRIGGAMQEAGNFISGGAATVGAGAGMMAGGPVGAAVGAGVGAAVGVAAQAATTAASGDQGEGAHQQATVGKAIDAIGAVSVAVFGAAKGFEFLSSSLMESSRDLRKFSSVINTSFAKQERQQVILAARTAHGTGGTARALGDSVMQMREAMQPLDESMQNVKNILGAGLAQGARLAAAFLGPMLKATNLAVDFFNWILDNKEEKDQPLPFERAMRAMAGWDGDRKPTNKRPKE